MTINHRELAGVDLDLLDALLPERSVTRAARHVGIGQPAMSSSPARLRKLLGDELLTRVPEGMALTPRAMALVESTRASLRQFQSLLLREDSFDPGTVERAFTLAVPGSVEMLFGRRLLAAILRQAPGIRLTFRVRKRSSGGSFGFRSSSRPVVESSDTVDRLQSFETEISNEASLRLHS